MAGPPAYLASIEKWWHSHSLGVMCQVQMRWCFPEEPSGMHLFWPLSLMGLRPPVPPTCSGVSYLYPVYPMGFQKVLAHSI